MNLHPISVYFVNMMCNVVRCCIVQKKKPSEALKQNVSLNDANDANVLTAPKQTTPATFDYFKQPFGNCNAASALTLFLPTFKGSSFGSSWKNLSAKFKHDPKLRLGAAMTVDPATRKQICYRRHFLHGKDAQLCYVLISVNIQSVC